jgi:PIN domain nuclease of toxin-antitoxin system
MMEALVSRAPLLAPPCSLPDTQQGSLECAVGHLHGDAADRMLVATANYIAAPLVTIDSRIIEFTQQEKRTQV